MKRRSLFTLTGLGLLGTAGLAACSGGKPAGEGSTSASKLETLRVHVLFLFRLFFFLLVCFRLF